MSTRIKHMGMTLTKEEHAKWHREHPEGITPEEHDKLMKRLGVTKKQDEEWHRTHLTSRQVAARGEKSINPFAVGGAFLKYCPNQGWLIERGTGRHITYYVTKEGERELKERFGIAVSARAR